MSFFSPPPPPSSPSYTLINHVGNRRFLVLLNIYRPRYFEANEQGDEAECKRIALDIVKTVSQQCVPHGRFLQQDANNSNQWHEIDEVASLVRIVEGQITKNVWTAKSGERPAKRARTTPTSNNLDLICQAAAKKFPKEGSLVDKPKPFDVICSGNSITPAANANHVGNNRFQVILDIRRKDFEASSSQEQRNRIVHDIVSTIMNNSSSRFLLSLDGSSGQYMPLSRESAVVCTRNALESKLLIVTSKQKTCNSEAKELVSRHYQKRVLDEVERRNNVFMHKFPICPKRVSYNTKTA